MYDYWMMIIGGVFGIWGLVGLITGSTTVYYQSRSGWGGHKPLFTYQGRGLASFMFLMGGALVGLYLLSHGATAIISPASANSYAGIVFVAGLGLGVLVSILQSIGLGRGTHDRARKKVPGVPLANAAKYLQIPESDLLQMAQNGGIEAHHINGTYVFDPEELRSFQESMERMN